MYTIIDKQTAMHYLWRNHCDAWVLTGNSKFSVKLERIPSATKEQYHFHKEALK